MRANAPSAHDLEAWVLAHLAEATAADPRHIDPQEPFARLGLGSVQATRMVAELADRLGRTLSPTLVWEYPTPAALAAYLATGAPQELAQGASVRAAQRAAAPDEPIAVVGIGCRFPGGADDPAAFWRLLLDGIDAIREVPHDRWNADAFQPRIRRGGFLERVDGFDPLFFGISPREAVAMDPQQRLALELAWEALEDAGISPPGLAGSDTGVFIGSMWSDYAALMHRAGVDEISEYTATGTSSSILANRLSYWLGSQGPSVALDTACSSSLVAVHLACQSLRSGEATLALAGGIHLMLAPDITIAMSRLRALSPDGTLRAFDAAANGYVRGEGGGLVVLKRLSHAQADGDRIYCIVRGSATNNDGASNGLTAPNPKAQEAVLRAAYRRAGIDPVAVHYVEAHGTGTPLGDPIEVRALGAVLGHGRTAAEPLRIGSVKTNIGHLEPAAGIASLIKLALAIHHRTLPPTLHFTTPNPLIPFADLHVRVQDRVDPWPRPGEPPIAGVSSFGFGGTNCHVVVAGLAPAPARLFVLSAPHEQALRAAAGVARERVADAWFVPQPDTTIHALDGHQPGAPWRLAITAHTPDELRARLDAFQTGTRRPGLAVGRAEDLPPRLVFVFPGAGSDWPGMCRGLLQDVPVFRTTLTACDRVIRERNGWSLIETLSGGPAPESALELQFVGIVAVELALAAVWRAWGIEPAAVVGHSIGEIAAACVAGCLTLEEAMTTICRYGRLIVPLAGKGATAVVGLPAATTAAKFAALGLDLTLIAEDSPTSTVVSGEPAAVQTFVAALEREGIFARQARLETATHSPLMDPLLSPYREAIRAHRPHPGDVLFVSTVTGAPASGESLDADHWARNMREPVRFAAAIEHLLSRGFDTFLEVGPHAVLQHPLQQCIAHVRAAATTFSSLHRQTDERTALLDTLGALHVRGCALRTAEPSPRELLPLSAHTPAALVAQAHRWADFLTHEGSPYCLRDICHTAQRRRTHQAYRRALVGNSAADLAAQLRSVRTTDLAPAATRPGVVFVFPGYGAQWLGMGRSLAATEPVFRRTLETCAAALSPWVDFSLFDELHADADHSRLGETPVGQTLTFALQVSLARLLQSWGVLPAAVIGHSMGEVAASHIAGALSLKDAARVIAVRNAIVRDHARRRGGMLMASIDISQAQSLLNRTSGLVSIAAVNAPRMVVLSGELEPLDTIATDLQTKGVFCRRVNVDYASHSPQMDPLLPLLREAVAAITPSTATVPFCSTVTGDFVDGTTLDAHYWGRNLREPVLFAPAIARLSDRCDTFLEISTHPLFVTAIEETLRERGASGEAIPLLRRDEDESFHARRAVARLHERGCTLDWAALYPASGHAVPVPAQAWQRERYWIDVPPPGHASARTSEYADWLYRVRWEPARDENVLPPGRTTWLLLADRSDLADRLRARLEQRGERCLLVRTEQAHADSSSDDIRIDPASPAQLEGVLQSARATAMDTTLHVVHLWSLDIAPLDALDAAACESMESLGCITVLHLAQALARAEHPARISLVTQGAQSTGPNAPACSVGQVPLLGMGRVLAYDFPTLPCRRIDLDHGPLAAQVELLVAELARGDTEDEVALRAGARLAPRLRAVAPDDPAARRDGPEAPVLHVDATYLITGGLGGLGLRAAQWLVHHGARHLVLLARSEPNETARQTIAALKAAGTQVVVATADVANEAELTTALAEVRRAMPPLRGVLHTAGVADLVSTHEIDAQRLTVTWAPKIRGTLNLHRLTLDANLDFLVLYASQAALTGSPGAAGYASANIFLDGLAQHRRATGRSAQCVYWGVWADVGMVAGSGPIAEAAHRFEIQGIGTMPPQSALRCLGRLLTLGEICTAAMRVDLHRWKAFHEGARRLSMLHGMPDTRSAGHAEHHGSTGPSHVQSHTPAARLALSRDALHSIPVAERRTHIETLVEQELVAALRLPSSAVDRSSQFSRYGLDSLMAMEFRRRLENALGIRLASTTLGKHPSIALLADALLRQLGFLEEKPDEHAAVKPTYALDREVIFEEDGIQYSLLTDADIEGAVACLCEAFPREPMTRLCGISAREFEPFARTFCRQAPLDGFSLIARDLATRAVIGCQVSEDYTASPALDMAEISPRFLPILALLEQLDKTYQSNHQSKRGEVFHLNLGAVQASHEGGIIPSRLIEISLALAAARGFRRALGHVAASSIQQLFRGDLGFREVARADYRAFEFEGRRVFESIVDPPATILMERTL